MISLCCSRRNLLGLTPATINGFILAGCIFAANLIFGEGWAANLVESALFPSQSIYKMGSSPTNYIDLDDPESLERYRVPDNSD
jgi:hypothetical protein